MKTKISVDLLTGLMIAAVLLLGASCRFGPARSEESVLALETGTYVFRSKANSLKVPFLVEDEITAGKAILLYLKANYRGALEKGIEGVDSIQISESEGKTTFYILFEIETTNILIFARKGGSEVFGVAIDTRQAG